jgi:hypothetical protein
VPQEAGPGCLPSHLRRVLNIRDPAPFIMVGNNNNNNNDNNKDGRAWPYGWTASLATLSKGLPDAVAARRRIGLALWDNLLRGRERYAKALCWESVGTWGWG